MKVDYIDLRPIDAVQEQIVRLYDFDWQQAKMLYDLLKETIIIKGQPFNFRSVPFISQLDCELTFELAEHNIGLEQVNNLNFKCLLTSKGFEKVLDMMGPFCIDSYRYKHQTYQWLDDLIVDSESDIWLLFSPDGAW